MSWHYRNMSRIPQRYRGGELAVVIDGNEFCVLEPPGQKGTRT